MNRVSTAIPLPLPLSPPRIPEPQRVRLPSRSQDGGRGRRRVLNSVDGRWNGWVPRSSRIGRTDRLTAGHCVYRSGVRRALLLLLLVCRCAEPRDARQWHAAIFTSDSHAFFPGRRCGDWEGGEVNYCFFFIEGLTTKPIRTVSVIDTCFATVWVQCK